MPTYRANDGLPKVTTGRSTGTSPATRVNPTLPGSRWGAKPPTRTAMNDSLPSVTTGAAYGLAGRGTTPRPSAAADPNWPAPVANSPQPGAGGNVQIYNPFRATS